MKVLLTIPDLCADTGGPPVVVTRMAASLRDRGAEVTLLHAQPPQRQSLSPPDGVRVVPLSWQGSPWRRYRAFRRTAASLITRHGIEVVHDHGLWLPENIGAADAARALRRPLVLQPCGMLQQWSLEQQALKKRLAWWGYQRPRAQAAAAAVFTSAAERAESARHLRAGTVQQVIPHGVDLPALDRHLPRRRQAVFLGRLHPKKQVHLLLSAWAELRPAGWQLVIAGSGTPEHDASLRAQAAALGLDAVVRFLGAVHGAEKSALLADSQLFLQPSLQENFGLSVAEALAHGLPALTTREMPWTELESAGCGWSVPADAAGVTGALAEALQLSPEQLAAMGARAQAMTARFSWSAAAAATLALYASLKP
jgi:glycosyltransferase involved in cell wall biosynthesis